MTTVLRESRLKKLPLSSEVFRQRGRDVTRLESFADAVFGFALTLLVVSLDVPKNFDDLFNAMRGFPAFAVCFLMLALIWNGHYKYCRRFGLDDGWSRFLTCVLLFLVLFYVYPLKFLFSLGINGMLFPDSTPRVTMTRWQFSALQVTYALGFAAVYLIITFLYLHAYRLRDLLELTAREKFETRYQIARLLTLVAMGVVAALLAVLPVTWRWAGAIYAFLFPIMRIVAAVYQRKRAAFLDSPAAAG